MKQWASRLRDITTITMISVFGMVCSAGIVHGQQLPLSSPKSPGASSATSSASSLSTIATRISPELKAKICDPSNPSLKVVNTTESQICGIPKTVKPAPTLTATPPKSATVSSISTSTTMTGGGPKIAPVSNATGRTQFSSAGSTIAPQINGIKQPHQSQQQIIATGNDAPGQNYTFASTSPVIDSGKSMYLGYHGDTAHTAPIGKSSTAKSGSIHSTSVDSSSKHTTSTRDSTHTHDSTKSKKSHNSGDSLEGVLKGVL